MIHSEDEITALADKFLPDANTYSFNETIITVHLPHQNTSKGYNVSYKKVRLGDAVGWKDNGIEEDDENAT
jgi:hypothetical protein